MEQTAGKRLSLLMEAKGFTTLTAFEAATGVKVGTASAIINGRSQPGNKVIALLRQAFPGFNGDWLRDGQGEMFERNLTPLATASQLPPPVPSHFEEAQPQRLTSPVMLAIPDLSHLSPQQQADYWQARWEKAARQLAEQASAREHEEIIRLIGEPGGKPLASLDAADEDYTPPFMTAEINPEYIETVPEADRIWVRGFGR